MADRALWARPRLRTDEAEHRERRVSWLELFYDLVFVVVISELTHYLASHPTLAGALGYALLFVPVCWVWIGGTFYNDRFETDDLSYRLIVFLQMLPVAAMALFVHAGLGETSVHFALAYAAARLLIILLWLRGGWHAPLFRPVSNRYAAGFALSVALFASSAYVAPPLRFVLWSVGLMIDLLTPLATLRLQARLPGLSRAKLAERFGLFVLIVLGESVVGVVTGLAAQTTLPTGVLLAGALALALTFGLWWVYFDFVARRAIRRGSWWGLAWNYLHLPLIIGIAALGAGVLNLLTRDAGSVSASTRWIIAGSVGAALLAAGLIELALEPTRDEPVDHRVSVPLKLAAGGLALALATWGSAVGRNGLLASLLLLVAVQAAYGALVRRRGWAGGMAGGVPAAEARGAMDDGV